MKYMAIIEPTNTGYSGYIPDFGTDIIGAYPTLEKMRTGLSEALSVFGLVAGLTEPKIMTLKEVPDHEATGETILEWVEPAPINPVSIQIVEVMHKQNLRPVDLAKRLGVSRANVVRILNPFYFGHSLALLGRVADALGMQLELPRFTKIKVDRKAA